MASCTFFGHRDTPEEIECLLKDILNILVKEKGVNKFYVGNQGNFDKCVIKVLKQLKNEHKDIRCMLVLAYHPFKDKNDCKQKDFDVIYPECLNSIPPKFAISYRNRWMIENADYVVTYVKYSFGCSAQFKRLSEIKGKSIIELNDC